ncbi:hypothetical protein O4G76_09590 [Limimaricola sp. G21655-S1]|uniref:hypothetical protein n=1 Tax=Limimaricola sp. G21655-S1 TaxID=3014768 RepID=UPI0022AF22B9|nr:hypothetical protein [Limimaricola sp. G21655-S1]MCZ4261090.1 hypothetical protein [Limimaricola sp. G21655-S1]
MSRRIKSTIHADRAGRGAALPAIRQAQPALPTASRPRAGATINAHGQKSPVPGLDGTP